MAGLVNRFHLLIVGVTLAIAGVAIIHVPQNYAFSAHWQGGMADWVWPRDVALAVAPVIQLGLVALFLILGRVIAPAHLVNIRHILDPALTLPLQVAAACQLGLLLNGIGSDFDMFRITAGLLSAVLAVLGVVIFEAERHSYGGLRMPWPIVSDRAWRIVHRASGVVSCAAAIGLGWLAWADPGPGVLVLAMVGSLAGLPIFAALVSLATRGP